jgi:DNA-binding transcriptional LysR family regulator
MRDSDWKIIYELHQHPSITKVSGLLYKSQSAITKRIQSIEEELECRIVERTPQGVSFTREGEFVYEMAEKHIRIQNELKDGLRKLREQNKETIRIGSAYTYTKYSLYDVLNPFSEAHPEISIRIINKQSNLLYEMLMEGELDAAFIRSDYTAQVYHELVDHTAAYCVTRDPVDLLRLPDMELVAYQTNQKTMGKIADWWRERFGTELPEPSEDAGYIEFAFRSISDGNKYLLCFLPDNFVNEYHLHLTPLLMKDGKPITRDSWFIYKKEKNRRTAVDELIRYVIKNVKIKS